jgi:hypothetical protein
MKTQCDEIIEVFKSHGMKLTLGELLESGRYSFAHKLSARLSDLRSKGYIITCIEREKPSLNIYEMTPPRFIEENGQIKLFETIFI